MLKQDSFALTLLPLTCDKRGRSLARRFRSIQKLAIAVVFMLAVSGVSNKVLASSGNVAFIAGPYTITPSSDGKTTTFNVAGIANTTTSTTSGSLEFQLWYSPMPYSGDTLSGYLISTRTLPIGNCTLSTLAPGGECVSIQTTEPVTPPPPGTYYPVLVLLEHDSKTCSSIDGFCIDDYVPLLRSSDGSQTVTVGAGTGTGSSAVMILGQFSSSLNFAAATAQINIAEIRNSSLTATTGQLRVELWLTTTPYSGGSINGYRIVADALTGPTNGELGPSQRFTNLSLTPPLSHVPGAGVYYQTLIITENSPACTAPDHFCIDTFGSFSSLVTIGGGGDTGGNPELTFVGTAGYSANFTTNTVEITVDQILNSSATNQTSPLRLELWLTTSAYNGGTITGNRVAVYQLTVPANGRLNPGQGVTGIDVTVPLGNLPSPGSYIATLVLSEQTQNCGSSDGYCIESFAKFSNTFDVPSAAPPPVVGGGGSSSSGGGGGGALDILGLFALGILSVLRFRLTPR
jgi:hypothetical protein